MRRDFSSVRNPGLEKLHTGESFAVGKETFTKLYDSSDGEDYFLRMPKCRDRRLRTGEIIIIADGHGLREEEFCRLKYLASCGTNGLAHGNYCLLTGRPGRLVSYPLRTTDKLEVYACRKNHNEVKLATMEKTRGTPTPM